MIDVLFVLVSFILVTAQFGNIYGKINVNLPQGGVKLNSTAKVPVTITIKQNGEIYFNDKKVFLWDLAATLADISPSRVFVKADKNVYYLVVAKVLDVVRKCGITKVSLLTNVTE